MKFHVIFIDNTAYKPYDQLTLELEPLGGTEASMVRLAEKLGEAGLNVAVVQHNRQNVNMGKAYYLPLSYLDSISAPFVVSLRGIAYLNKFPNSKKYSWQHDLPDERLLKMRDFITDKNVDIIAVSKFHKTAVKELMCKDEFSNPKVKYIYNPVPENVYVPKDVNIPYNNKKLVWMSSPHKGLNKAIQLFKALKEVSGETDWQLHVFNPGYYSEGIEEVPGVINHGPLTCSRMWQFIQDSLCVFYPAQIKETFGLIAAEANALHVPVLTYEMGAVCETTYSREELIPINDERKFIDTAIKWSKGQRPKVLGQHRFKSEEVAAKWISELLSVKLI